MSRGIRGGGGGGGRARVRGRGDREGREEEIRERSQEGVGAPWQPGSWGWTDEHGGGAVGIKKKKPLISPHISPTNLIAKICTLPLSMVRVAEDKVAS